MSGRLILPPTNPSLDANGDPVAGSTLTFYLNNTTTLQAVYSAADLLTPLANPLTCDAAGIFPQVWTTDGLGYSVKWSRPGLSPVTFNDIYPSAANGGLSVIRTFLSGTSYTPTTGAVSIEVTLQAAGGGGSGNGGAGGDAADTTFNAGAFTAKGGKGGSDASGGGLGGTGGVGTAIRTPGSPGGNPFLALQSGTSAAIAGGVGGGTGGGTGGRFSNGVAGTAGSGGGGQGAGTATNSFTNISSGIYGYGGGSGEKAVFTLAAAVYSYSLGAAGVAGNAAGVNAGGTGGTASITIKESFK